MKIKNLNREIPKINKYVFILDDDFADLTLAKLQVYTEHSDLDIDEGDRLKIGDIYWHYFDRDIGEERWTVVDNFNYWIECEDLESFIREKINNIEKPEEIVSSRSELLDL